MAVLAFDGVILGDLAIPFELFSQAKGRDGEALYDVRICAPTTRVASRGLTLETPWRLPTLARCDTVIVPGIEPGHEPADAAVRALRRAVDRGARVASICTGAFVLAATGALDGLRATTHWMAADELARRHPLVTVDADVLYVDNGRVLTSAGAAAGHDLCLHMIRRDFGAEAAAAVARTAVMPLERSGGQAQFIVRDLPTARSQPMGEVLAWMDQHLGDELRLPEIAQRFAMSERSFHRHFAAQVGMTPARWIVQARVRRAQQLLEATDFSIERIAGEVGFGAATVLRQRFAQVVGASPTTYRRAYRG